MRVTHVITRLIVGGAQENTISSVLGLRRKAGLEVDLISGPTEGPEGSLEPLVSSQPGLLTHVDSLVRPVKPMTDLWAYETLVSIFKDRKPDIVHTHSGKAGVLGRLAARKAGVPIIIHTIHGPSFGTFQGAGANFIFKTAEKIAGRATTHFVVVSQAMMDQYLAAGIGRAEQYSRVFSGFDLEPYLTATNDESLRERLGIEPEDIVIGKIARLFELKGHEDVIAVAANLVRKHPRVKFLFVGDGTLRAKHEEQIRRAGLTKHFVFAGLVSPREVARYTGVMDILVHLSRREGLPRALPQALAAGKPVVACDCDGAREVCLDGRTGFLVAPGDLGALEQRLDQLISDEALRRRFGDAGREFVRSRFATQTMVDELHALYLRLAREKGLKV